MSQYYGLDLLAVSEYFGITTLISGFRPVSLADFFVPDIQVCARFPIWRDDRVLREQPLSDPVYLGGNAISFKENTLSRLITVVESRHPHYGGFQLNNQEVSNDL